MSGHLSVHNAKDTAEEKQIPLWNYNQMENEIHKRLHQLDAIRHSCIQNSGASHDCTIQTHISNGCIQYIKYTKTGKRQHISKKDPDLVNIVQSTYDQMLSRFIDKERRLLHSFLSFYKNKTVDNLYNSLNPARKSLVVSHVINKDKFIQQWISLKAPSINTYQKNDYNATFQGEQVRSKSEVLIADRLEKFKIPYRYEFPLTLKNGKTIFPDFTILHPQTLQTYYLEHFGMVDDSYYANSMVRKLNDYAKNGIFPGKQLIVTFETKDSPLNTQNVEALLLSCFLPQDSEHLYN